MFDSIFGGENQNIISIWIFLLCILISLIDGLIYFLSFSIKNSGKKSFKTALFFLPTVVCSNYDGKWKYWYRSSDCRSFFFSEISFFSR